MIKNIKTGLAIFIGVCLITTVSSGCRARNEIRSPGQPNIEQQGQRIQQQGVQRENLPETTLQPGQVGMNGVNPENNQGINQGDNTGDNRSGRQMIPNMQKAENVRNQLSYLKEVADTNVIVMGNTALVGYKPSGNTRDINAARNKITNIIKKIDGSITNVIISEQSDIMNRINQLGDDITNNRPMDAINNDFKQIIGGINPSGR